MLVFRWLVNHWKSAVISYPNWFGVYFLFRIPFAIYPLEPFPSNRSLLPTWIWISQIQVPHFSALMEILPNEQYRYSRKAVA